MYKLVKWAYELGIKHERRRVKILIGRYRNTQPIQIQFDNEKRYTAELDKWRAVSSTLDRLIEPSFNRTIENYKTPLGDEEDLI